MNVRLDFALLGFGISFLGEELLPQLVFDRKSDQGNLVWVNGEPITVAQAEIGSFPFPNARDISALDSWLDDISSELGKVPSLAPYAVNISTHRSYDRLKDELDLTKNHKPRIVITALGGPEPVIETVQSYGGTVVAEVNSHPECEKSG